MYKHVTLYYITKRLWVRWVHIGHVLTHYYILYHQKVVSQVSVYCHGYSILYHQKVVRWVHIGHALTHYSILYHQKVVSQVSVYWACINTLLYIISPKGCESGECILGMYKHVTLYYITKRLWVRWVHIGHVLTHYYILYHQKVVSQVSAYWHVLTHYSILYHQKVVSQVSAYWACINTLTLYYITKRLWVRWVYIGHVLTPYSILYHQKVVSQVSAYWACINTLLYIISPKGCESGECILGMY